jgi:hypothetical protein
VTSCAAAFALGAQLSITPSGRSHTAAPLSIRRKRSSSMRNGAGRGQVRAGRVPVVSRWRADAAVSLNML